MAELSRRTLIGITGAIGAAMLPIEASSERVSAQQRPAAPGPTTAAQPMMPAAPAPDMSKAYLFLNDEEVAFIAAAVARLIPEDDKWPGAVEAGVPNYIDKQLGGAWGAGERLYRAGPWQPGTPSQGYQLPFTPAELFRISLSAINAELSKAATPFAKMSPDEQDAYLESLEAGGKSLGGVPSDVFFSHLWECTIEGFFSDPVYGGNREMAAWRMIGFPGAYASYYDLVDQHGVKIARPPMSLAEDAHGHMHMNPGIPARSP